MSTENNKKPHFSCFSLKNLKKRRFTWFYKVKMRKNKKYYLFLLYFILFVLQFWGLAEVRI